MVEVIADHQSVQSTRICSVRRGKSCDTTLFENHSVNVVQIVVGHLPADFLQEASLESCSRWEHCYLLEKGNELVAGRHADIIL